MYNVPFTINHYIFIVSITNEKVNFINFTIYFIQTYLSLTARRYVRTEYGAREETKA